ncbi:MAG: YafY family protein [Candidatus Sericytochromatia bacterium]
MAKSKRLVELIMAVNAKKKFTVRELSEEFGVSYRTILRDLQELEEIGVPLYSEVGPAGGYSILKERLLPPISFTESEALSLFFISQSLKYYDNLPFENEIESALKKFYHYLPTEVKKTIDSLNKRLAFWNPIVKIPTPFLKEILNTSLEQKVIEITYDSVNDKSIREIQPIGVYTIKGLWYAPAYCFKSKEFRLFRVDRILKISKEKTISEKIDLDNFTISDWLKSNNVKIDNPRNIHLVVRLTKKGVKKCESDNCFFENIKVNKDGSGVLEADLPESYNYWLINYFMFLGKEAIVEKPLKFRNMIKKELESLIKLYN